MNQKNKLWIILLSSIVIVLLFHRTALGLNLLIFEFLFFLWLWFNQPLRMKGVLPMSTATGTLLTLFFTLLTNSVYSYVVHFICLIIFIGTLIYPEAKSIISLFRLSASNLISSQKKFYQTVNLVKPGGREMAFYANRMKIFLLPLLVVLVFVVIYRVSNPVFDKLMVRIQNAITEAYNFVLQDFDFLILFTMFIGLLISNFLFLKTRDENIINTDSHAMDFLYRNRVKSREKKPFNALKNEYKSAVFLFFILNILLLVVNVIDISWVWFNFKWDGNYLKQFVHEGTYLLIFSLFLSIALVLFFFRANLNFYRNNRVLRYLSYLWLMQNVILAISVAIRNIHYIEHFALAYKRIGVFIFLLATIYALYSVVIKVAGRKSSFFLLRINAYAMYLCLVFSSLVNWDSLIARYNFAHSGKAFVHLEFLATLSDKSLPYLDKSMDELKQIDKVQDSIFHFDKKPMSPATYHGIIETRKQRFLKEWEKKSVLSWNLPEYLAYRKLTIKNAEIQEMKTLRASVE